MTRHGRNDEQGHPARRHSDAGWTSEGLTPVHLEVWRRLQSASPHAVYAAVPLAALLPPRAGIKSTRLRMDFVIPDWTGQPAIAFHLRRPGDDVQSRHERQRHRLLAEYLGLAGVSLWVLDAAALPEQGRLARRLRRVIGPAPWEASSFWRSTLATSPRLGHWLRWVFLPSPSKPKHMPKADGGSSRPSVTAPRTRFQTGPVTINGAASPLQGAEVRELDMASFEAAVRDGARALAGSARRPSTGSAHAS